MIETKEISFLDEVVSVEDMGEMETYDFTIPETHCFFANGILIHNSGFLEENSDVVILLDWMCKHTETDDKSFYMAHIAKNRNGRTGYVRMDFEPQYYNFKEHVEETPYQHAMGELNDAG